MDKLANILTDFCMNRNKIQEDRREIYCYGFKLIIADIINFSIVLIVGLLLNKVFDSILFLITLCGTRQFSGGFHARSFWLCRLSMIITFISVFAISNIVAKSHWELVWCTSINILCVITMAVLAPVIHPNKILTEIQKQKNKIKSIITSFIMAVISIVLVLLDVDGGVTISITLLAVIVLMIVSLIMHREVN
ncbi:MAG: accessory gene regulator B family protein [Clostridia bacterium]|nr:accessory gene regulator B family protein [Clostridia bacterium]